MMNKVQRGPIVNLEAEQAVLGAILIRPEKLAPVRAVLSSPKYFYREAHSLVYKAILDLTERDQPVDLLTVTALLRERSQLEAVGGPVFLAALSEQVGFAVNADHYARLVHEKYTVRQLRARALEIVEGCEQFNGDGKIDDLLLYAEGQIQDCTNHLELDGPPLVPAPELLAKDFSQTKEVIGDGVLPAGCNLIIAGESGDGKSMLRLEMGLYIALGRDIWGLKISRVWTVLIIQFENHEHLEQVRLKRMVRGLQIDCPKNLIFSSPLVRFNLGEKRDRVRLIDTIKKAGAEVVIYDPLSSLHQENENDNAKMRWIMDNLTEINRRTQTTAIVVHHYGKPGKEDAGGQYRTRGASSIKDWADTLLGFSRQKSHDQILRKLEFLKVRNGPEPKPLILARDKETFLSRVNDEERLCSPAMVRGLVEGSGGQVGHEELVKAIQHASGCKNRRAREFLQEAITFGYVLSEDHPTDKRKKIYRAV